MSMSYSPQLKLSLLISLWFLIVVSESLASQDVDSSNQILVSIDWLIQHQSDPKLMIVDARSEAEFNQGHIRGAINIPVAKTFNPQVNTDRVGNIKYIMALFRQAGIRNDHTLVIYDENSYIDAGRVFWVFEVYGHKNVKLLNGGIKGWRASAQQPLSNISTPHEISDYVPTINSQRLTTKFSMRLAIEDNSKIIIDSRGKEDFKGDQSIASRYGHIPRAINIPWTENFVETDGVKLLKPFKKLKKIYSKVKKNQRIILYCNKGKQSSLSYTVMRHLGYDVAHYDGSWYEWGNDVTLPIVEKNKNIKEKLKLSNEI